MSGYFVAQRLVSIFGHAIEHDEDINGGDAVDHIVVELYPAAKQALQDLGALPVEKVCERLLDSEEHACESAVPQVAEDAVALIRTLVGDSAAECASAAAASRFMAEVLNSVETLSGIGEQYGVRTLADLWYLHAAIAESGFIDFHPGESHVLEVVSDLPSSEEWLKYIRLEDGQGVAAEGSLSDPDSLSYLTNACGESTGHGSLTLSQKDRNKVPFEDGPGSVLPYVGEIAGEAYVIGNLECSHQDPFWGDDSADYLPRGEILAYCTKVREILASRLPAGGVALPLDEGMPGRIVVGIALPLKAMTSRDNTREALAQVFGDFADYADLPAD